jgi:hypothetical protein
MLIIDDTKRREWLRALRRFKYGVKVRAKLGILQTICEQVAVERVGQQQWDAPVWEHPRWTTLLYTCIKDNTYPPELLIGFAKTAEVTFMATKQQPTVDRTIAAMHQVCKRLSKPLRQKFGVFCEVTDGDEQETP